MVVLEVGDLEESGLGRDPEEKDLGEGPGGEGLEEKHLEEADLVEVGHGHEEGMELSYCVEAAGQSRLWVPGGRDASWVDVALWASSAGAWVAHCAEGGVGRALEGTAACVAAGGLEDAAVASDRAAHPADHRRESGGSQEGHQGADLEVHQPGCPLGPSGC